MRNAFTMMLPLALVACGSANSESREAGPSGARSFAVGKFTAISLDGSDNVRVIRGTTIGVTATAAQNTIDQLDIRVDGSTLKISRKRNISGMRWTSDRGANIVVTVPVLTAVAVSGSGDMTVDRADSVTFSAVVDGSGDLTVAALTAKRAQLSASGSGNIDVRGTADAASLTADGSGNIDAKGFTSRRATIAANGSGDVEASVTGDATIAVDGSGSVDVVGTDRCTIANNGSGTARCSR